MIFTNNLKRMLKDKANLVFMLLLPVIFIAFSMSVIGGSTQLKVAIIDNDNTCLTSILKEKLGETTELIDVQEKDIKQKLINGKLEYTIKIHEGFTEELILGKDVQLETMSIKETNASVPVKHYLDSMLNASKNIALVAKGSEPEFYKAMELYNNNAAAVNYSSIENFEQDTKLNTYLSFGFMVTFMLFMSTNAASLILEDKHLKTYDRVLSSPITAKSYFIQNLLSYIAITIMQLLAIFFILVSIFKADMGPSIGNLLVLFMVFALTSVTLGLAISSISKDLRQNNAIAYLITIPMSMLGGCFWSIDIMPKPLQQLSHFTPVSWVLKAAEKLLWGSSLTGVIQEILILLLFALVFFIIGANKRVMMSSSK